MIAVDKVAGIGPKTAAFLAERGVGSVAALLEAGRELLMQAPGFNEARARTVLANAAILSGAGTGQEEKEIKREPGKGGEKPAGKAKDKKAKKKKEKQEKKKKKSKKNKKGKKTKKKDKKKKGGK